MKLCLCIDLVTYSSHKFLKGFKLLINLLLYWFPPIKSASRQDNEVHGGNLLTQILRRHSPEANWAGFTNRNDYVSDRDTPGMMLLCDFSGYFHRYIRGLGRDFRSSLIVVVFCLLTDAVVLPQGGFWSAKPQQLNQRSLFYRSTQVRRSRHRSSTAGSPAYSATAPHTGHVWQP